MDMLKVIIKLFCAAALIASIAGCNSDGCSSAEGTFYIENWSGPIPKQAVLSWYKKGSNFKILEKKDTHFIANQPDLKNEFISIKFDEGLPTGYDYKLVLDDKIEYRIYGLDSGGGNGRTCIVWGMINQCEVNGETFTFSKECGIPVK